MPSWSREVFSNLLITRPCVSCTLRPVIGHPLLPKSLNFVCWLCRSKLRLLHLYSAREFLEEHSRNTSQFRVTAL